MVSSLPNQNIHRVINCLPKEFRGLLQNCQLNAEVTECLTTKMAVFFIIPSNSPRVLFRKPVKQIQVLLESDENKRYVT